MLSRGLCGFFVVCFIFFSSHLLLLFLLCCQTNDSYIYFWLEHELLWRSLGWFYWPPKIKYIACVSLHLDFLHVNRFLFTENFLLLKFLVLVIFHLFKSKFIFLSCFVLSVCVSSSLPSSLVSSLCLPHSKIWANPNKSSFGLSQFKLKVKSTAQMQTFNVVYNDGTTTHSHTHRMIPIG